MEAGTAKRMKGRLVQETDNPFLDLRCSQNRHDASVPSNAVARLGWLSVSIAIPLLVSKEKMTERIVPVDHTNGSHTILPAQKTRGISSDMLSINLIVRTHIGKENDWEILKKHKSYKDKLTNRNAPFLDMIPRGKSQRRG